MGLEAAGEDEGVLLRNSSSGEDWHSFYSKNIGCEKPGLGKPYFDFGNGRRCPDSEYRCLRYGSGRENSLR